MSSDFDDVSIKFKEDDILLNIIVARKVILCLTEISMNLKFCIVAR